MIPTVEVKPNSMARLPTTKHLRDCDAATQNRVDIDVKVRVLGEDLKSFLSRI